MSGPLPPNYHLTPVDDLAFGLDQVRAHRLYHADQPDSHVWQILSPPREQGVHPETGECVVALWWVTTVDQPHTPVGIALVSLEKCWAGHSFPPMHCLNLYVHPTHAGQGLGSRLAEIAKERFSDLKGHYNMDTVSMFERLGITDTLRHVVGQQPHSTIKNDARFWDTHFQRRHRQLHAARWDPTQRLTGWEPPHRGEQTLWRTLDPHSIEEPVTSHRRSLRRR